MKKIILIGLVCNHHSLYRLLLKLLSLKFDEITFLTDSEIVKQIDNMIDTNIVTILLDNGRIDKILNRNLKLINNHDIMIMDEYYDSYHLLYKTKFKSKKKIAIIHNVNKWFQAKLNYKIKYLLDQLFKPLFFNQFDAFITMGPNIKEYFQVMKNNKPVFFFPFDQLSLEKTNESVEKETIDIVLPGMISEDRRNYKDILTVLEKYFHDNPESKIRIKFLGRIVSEKEKFVAERSDKINKKFGNRISYWNEFISDIEFEKEIESSDLILSNVKVFNNLKDRMEIYGITKESGVSFIIYKYAKAAIVPKFQNILFGFESQLIKFECYDDLYDIFKNLDNQEIDLGKLIINAKENRKIFNERISEENSKILNYLLEA